MPTSFSTHCTVTALFILYIVIAEFILPLYCHHTAKNSLLFIHCQVHSPFSPISLSQINITEPHCSLLQQPFYAHIFSYYSTLRFRLFISNLPILFIICAPSLSPFLNNSSHITVLPPIATAAVFK